MFTTSLLLPPLPFLSPPLSSAVFRSSQPPLHLPSFKLHQIPSRNPFLVRGDEFDDDGYDPYDFDEFDPEEYNEDKDELYFEGDVLAPEDDAVTALIESQGLGDWDFENSLVDYRINEDDFHKISLLDCDFFVRKHPDPDDDVYDFSEMYVTPPDTDIYSVPRVLAPMPQKPIRCALTDFACLHGYEPIIDAPRDPMVMSDRYVLKVFLTKHYGNVRLEDPDFVLDFEEIYVIDSKSKSITRAKVVVTIPEGRNRDRKNDLLIIRDYAATFKIIHKDDQIRAEDVIEREDWEKSRVKMEKYLSKLRDFDKSNWI